MDPAAEARMKILEGQQERLTAHVKNLQKECQRFEKSIEDFKNSSLDCLTVSKITEANIPDLPEFESDISREEVLSEKIVSSVPAAESARCLAKESSKNHYKNPPNVPVKDHIAKANWEIVLGQTWLVRIGIISLLTGLIFLSTYAYKNWIYEAPAIIKVSCFMFLSLGLSGLGFQFEKSKRNLQLYGRSITAGGLALGYYTIYAAHFVESFNCISSPFIASIMLTTWAIIMLLYASWKQSCIISIMSIGLAFYGTIINPAGWLSLFSALLLSICGMFLLIRYKWSKVGIFTVCGAYIAHAFWLGYYPQNHDPFIAICYLTSYWIIFACATSRLAGPAIIPRVAQLITTFNNSFSWLLAAFTVPDFAEKPELGKFSLIFGSIYIVCGCFSHYRFIWEKFHAKIHLYIGLFLLTLGILVESIGYHRFLILSLEAIVLMAAGYRLKNNLLKATSFVVYCISLCSIFFSYNPPTISFVVLSIISLIYTGITRQSFNDNNKRILAIFPACMSWLIVYFGIFNNYTQVNALSYTILIATLIWILFLTFKKPNYLQDIALLASIIPIFCGSLLCFYHFNSDHSLGFALPLIGTGMWWSSKQINQLLRLTSDNSSSMRWSDSSDVFAWLYSCFTCCSIYQLVHLSSNTQLIWLYLGGLIAISAHYLGSYTKRISITFPAQLFHVIAIFNISNTQAESLLPFTMLLIHMFLNEYFWGAKLILRRCFAPLAAIALCKITHYPETTLTLLALCFYALCFYRKDNILTITGTITTLLLASFDSINILRPNYEILDYIPMVTLIIIASIPHRNAEILPKKWHIVKNGFKFITLILLFTYASLHTLENYNGNRLAICWALLAGAIFSIGLLTQHRSYRLTGLVWLAASIIHVVTIDVMALNTLGRIFSFIIIGIILITLGYLYNRYQKRILKFL